MSERATKKLVETDAVAVDPLWNMPAAMQGLSKKLRELAAEMASKPIDRSIRHMGEVALRELKPIRQHLQSNPDSDVKYVIGSSDTDLMQVCLGTPSDPTRPHRESAERLRSYARELEALSHRKPELLERLSDKNHLLCFKLIELMVDRETLTFDLETTKKIWPGKKARASAQDIKNLCQKANELLDGEDWQIRKQRRDPVAYKEFKSSKTN